MKEYKNYLFDLYGTLVDIHTDETSPQFWRQTARLLAMQGVQYTPAQLKAEYAHRIALLEEAAAAALPVGATAEIDLGIVFRGFFEDAGAEADERTIADFAMAFRVLSLKKLRLFPGAKAMLQNLHRQGKKVYLLSNAQALFTRPELKLLGLDTLLDGSILSSEAGIKKPDPEFYRTILRRYGLSPENTCMVGNDGLCDCHGAAAAGLDSFYIQTEQSPPLSGPLPDNCTQIRQIGEISVL